MQAKKDMLIVTQTLSTINPIHQRNNTLRMSNSPPSPTAVPMLPPPLTPPPARYLRSGSPSRWRRVASPMSYYNASTTAAPPPAAHPVWPRHDDATAAQRRGESSSSSSLRLQQQQLIMERWRVKCPQCQVSQEYQPAESSTTFGDVSTRYSHNARVLHQAATCPICLDVVKAPIVVLACGHTICPEHFQCIHGKVGPAAMLSFQETLNHERQERARERQERHAARTASWQAEAMDLAAALGEHVRTLEQQTTTHHLEHVRQVEAIMLRAHQRQASLWSDGQPQDEQRINNANNNHQDNGNN